MAKAQKLPSGNWRCRVYSHTDSYGKRIYESFTASSKKEAEMMAAKFQSDSERQRADDLTVKEAVQRYIDSNKNILSPSTLRGYTMEAKRLKPIDHLKVRKIRSVDIQYFISDMAASYSPKTVKNTYALLVTSIGACGVDTRFKVNLPTIPKRRKNAPENEQIKALYDTANDTMKKAIVLAAFHSLRRGEICGLKYGDLNGNALYVHSDVVIGLEGRIHKDNPKNDTSNRTVYLTQKEVEILGSGNPDDYIVPIAPSTLDHNFLALTKRLGIEGITLHTLRSYFASVAVAIGIPDLYASHMGGWKENSTVLKEVYQKKIVSMDEAYSAQLNSYFDSFMHHEYDTENKKPLNHEGFKSAGSGT